MMIFYIRMQLDYYLKQSKTKQNPKNPDLPCGPVVRLDLPVQGLHTSLIPGVAKMLHASPPKNETQNRSKIVTNSKKTLKLVHIKNKFFLIS